MKFSRRIKFFGSLFVSIILLSGIFVWSIGGVLVSPANHAIGNPPANLHAQNVEFSSASGATLHGWLVPGKTASGVIVLMHGVHSDRRSLVARADFLSKLGYSILMFDFQGHGESLAKNITFGFLESRDATAAVKFVRAKFPGEKIGVIGISLGAASALLAAPPLPVNALVLESSYPTIYDATRDRMVDWFGFLGDFVTPLLTCQLKPRLGIGLDDLKPIERAKKISAPKFFIAGTTDRLTTLAEAKALFAAAAEPKQCWWVEGAAHVDLQVFARAEYEKRLGVFLAENLH